MDKHHPNKSKPKGFDTLEVDLERSDHFLRVQTLPGSLTRVEMWRRSPVSSRISPVMPMPNNDRDEDTEEEEFSETVSNASDRASFSEGSNRQDNRSPRPRSLAGKSTPKRVYHTTLAVISLDAGGQVSADEDEVVVEDVQNKPSTHAFPKACHSPISYKSGEAESIREDIFGHESKREQDDDEDEDYCCFWPFTLLNNKPVLRLIAVMTFNGILSMICAALIMEIELPAQVNRLAVRKESQEQVKILFKNITDMINNVGTPDYNSFQAVELLEKFSKAAPKVRHTPDEIRWDMLSAQAFITSVQTTTGYGDIVPVTFWGKLFTLGYALVGIPIFMWYIVKLGGVFRLLVMKAIFWLLICICPSPDDHDENGDRFDRRRSTATRMKILEMKLKLNQQYHDDKRFHPSVIGVILLTFLCSVAIFISYMEDITYFDSFYAAFITYSAIGFGDIDIFKISYRSNWFNLLIYGNFIHIAGYMILSAWVASMLEKCGVRKY
ncbi:hypothetical protein TCAL_17392 [Tigriopus californicus]|uniref:Potassium channel domain-containing protein n=1 Tax=Tigriopus californicus TaxID=6832 RepID=A0A553PR51_TIGCA|nr:TWiK family of potassium channels protein 7-like [Tigriopus californicus]TRY80154.1 hypothetical protein TCAL_17392 [Tigriopus californicus]|eukprot:TCALIF_05802-PA protein Name:"Similar to twk-18 TWiK family of potassium channels protein 18 (Caenorhabditis elegans)" AED:0.00 eAED:0.00 QI:99/1/1/1/1/1/6/506/495